MAKHRKLRLAPAAMLLIAGTVTLAQQAPPRGPPAPAPDVPASLAHIDAARAIAGNDLSVTFDFFCVPGNARANSQSAPGLTPVKLFDNLYAVGNTETVVYALTTSDGIVLIDAGMPAEIETLVVPGLIALGLDPADIQYVLLGHGHVDHYGGAAFLQSEYGARVGTTAVDWDMIAAEAPNPQAGAAAKPNRDLVLTENESVTLGDTTVTLVEIPGHTPGALAFIFPVFDGGEPHMAGLFGGTALTFGFIQTPALTNYVESIAHFREVAQAMQVDVEVQNHPIFDDTPARLAALATRRSGAPHPFVMGSERYDRFWNVISECMQAELARRAAAQ